MADNIIEDAEDILNNSLALLGGKPVLDDEIVRYGSLTLSIAPKEGKANTLLADNLFSPALLLAERIERGLIPLHHRTVIELGAGCGLPSLLSATLSSPPTLVVVTDYPDAGIIANLQANVTRNRALFSSGCTVFTCPYEWGTDVGPLLKLAPATEPRPGSGYDVVILSDLLYFHTSHSVLVSSLTSLLARTSSARAYISAGKYTSSGVCNSFIYHACAAGLSFEEGLDEAGAPWLGMLPVGGLDREQLAVRKGMCCWWTARWPDGSL